MVGYMGCIGLCILYCRYVRDKVNCLLCIICLLFAGRVSMEISIYSFFLKPNNATAFGLVQLVPPPLLE